MVAKENKDENASDEGLSRTEEDYQEDFNSISGAVLQSKASDEKI